MTTNAVIIRSALRELNVLGETQNLSPEQGSEGLKHLNRLMNRWRTEDIDIGYFDQTDTTATCPIPDWFEDCAIYALAVKMAPSQSAIVTGELYEQADAAIRSARSKQIREKLEGADMSHMAGGAGHWNIQTDV